MAPLRLKVGLAGSDELRRIALERDLLTFGGLCEALAYLFPHHFPGAIIQYRDEDGDFITMKSDPELAAALPDVLATLRLTVVPTAPVPVAPVPTVTSSAPVPEAPTPRGCRNLGGAPWAPEKAGRRAPDVARPVRPVRPAAGKKPVALAQSLSLNAGDLGSGSEPCSMRNVGEPRSLGSVGEPHSRSGEHAIARGQATGRGQKDASELFQLLFRKYLFAGEDLAGWEDFCSDVLGFHAPGPASRGRAPPYTTPRYTAP